MVKAELEQTSVKRRRQTKVKGMGEELGVMAKSRTLKYQCIDASKNNEQVISGYGRIIENRLVLAPLTLGNWIKYVHHLLSNTG